jgi:hypothetical protein
MKDEFGGLDDCRAHKFHGFPMGPSLAGRAATDHRFFNGTSIRYPINTRAWELKGIGPDYYGANYPILSPHPGGAQAVTADGSVHFLAEALDLQTLFNLSNRDDGNRTEVFD